MRVSFDVSTAGPLKQSFLFALQFCLNKDVNGFSLQMPFQGKLMCLVGVFSAFYWSEVKLFGRRRRHLGERQSQIAFHS